MMTLPAPYYQDGSVTIYHAPVVDCDAMKTDQRQSQRERQRRHRARQKGEEIPALRPGPPKGYTQSPEHVLAKSRWGPEHHAWKGSAVKDDSGRNRAQRRFPSLGICCKCGEPATDRHHKDGDTTNNCIENIAFLCRRCHMLEDGRLEKLVVARRARA